jgi:hypothetical protein
MTGEKEPERFGLEAQVKRNPHVSYTSFLVLLLAQS